MKMERRTGGFTLLEVMISLTITAVIVVMLFGALRVGVRAWEKGEEDLDVRLRNRVVLDMIKRQLASVMIREQKEEEKNSFLFIKGSDSSLRFVSHVPLMPANEFGVVFVRYNVVEGAEGKRLDVFEKNLVFMDREADPEKIGLEDSLPFLNGISSVAFSYLRRGEDGDEEWQDKWDPEEDEGLPAAFKVTMQPFEGASPMVAVARVEGVPGKDQSQSLEVSRRGIREESKVAKTRSAAGTTRRTGTLGTTKSRLR